MTALRELADDWRTRASNLSVDPRDKRRCAIGQSYRDCANELLAALDAEGDGGAVDDAVSRDSALAAIGHVERHNGPGRAKQAREMLKPVTHPARSGVVRDEDVDAVIKSVERVNTDGMDGYSWDRILVRAALEHFAKGERHA